jgi:hypothetical protein
LRLTSRSVSLGGVGARNVGREQAGEHDRRGTVGRSDGVG